MKIFGPEDNFRDRILEIFMLAKHSGQIVEDSLHNIPIFRKESHCKQLGNEQG